jgi:hypothetical protein
MNAAEKIASETPLQSDQKTKREKSTLTKVLPTDRIAFDKQVKILQAFAACYESNAAKPVSSKLAGETVTPKFSESTLLVAVPFFADIGLLTRIGGDFVPCPELVAYNQAVSLSASEAKRKLRPVFEKTWFCRLLVPRVQLNPLAVKECVGILAVEATAGADHIGRVEPLINFLELSGIVSITGTMVSFVPPNGVASTPETKLLSQEPTKQQDDSVHTYVLPLLKKRKVTVEAPLDITKEEIQRLQKWIEFTLLLDWKDDAGT